MVAHQPGKAALVEKYTLPALLDAITSMATQSDVATLPQRTLLADRVPHHSSRTEQRSNPLATPQPEKRAKSTARTVKARPYHRSWERSRSSPPRPRSAA
jgi:hypothetical protein